MPVSSFQFRVHPSASRNIYPNAVSPLHTIILPKTKKIFICSHTIALSSLKTTMSSKVDFLTQPAGKPDGPYVISFLGGELIVIPTSNSVMRLIVTGEETGNAFCVVGTGGTSSDPIGFHNHRQAHDVFLCLKGEVNVWANNESRTLTPGDLASVPPVRNPSPSWSACCKHCRRCATSHELLN